LCIEIEEMKLSSMICRHQLVLLICITLSSAGGIQSDAQEPPAVPEPATPDATLLTVEQSQKRQEEIKQKLAALDASGLSEDDRKKAAEFYQKALNALASVDEYRGQKIRHENNINKYKAELEKYQTDLANLSTAEFHIDLQVDLANLELELAKQEQIVQSAREELAKSEQQLKDRPARLVDIPQQTVERQKELEKATADFETAAGKDATDILASAERDYLGARIDALKMSLAEMTEQRRYYTMSPDLAQVRRDFRAKQLAQEEKKLAALRQVIDARRIEEAEKQATAAAQMAAVVRPEAIAELAKRNSELAEEQARIAANSAVLTDEKAAIEAQKKDLSAAFDRSQERVAQAGSAEVGQELRRRQEMLPDLSAIRRRIALGNQEKEDASYQYFELMERRGNIVDAEIDDRVAEILQQIPADQQSGAQIEIRKLLDDELNILKSAIKAYDTYRTNLTELLAAEEELRIETRAYSDFIAEHVLWIRSTNLPRLSDIEAGAGAVAWTIDPDNWRDVVNALRKKASDWPVAVTLFMLVMIFSVYTHSRLRNRLRAIGEKAAKRTSTDFWPSLEALWITLLLSLPWPLLLGFVGWWMESPLNESEFVRALSQSLKFTACCFLLLELVRHLCRNAGLADAHFNWPQSCLLQVRRHVRWLIWICLPLVAWLTALEVQNVEKLWSSSLGRLCFVVVMLLLSFAAYRVLLSRKSPFRQLLTKKADSIAMRLFHIWSPLVTVLPGLLAVLAIVGYHYTAYQLAIRLLETAGLVLVLAIIGGLAKRWILVNRRRLAREQAKQKRAQALAAAEAVPTSDEIAPVVPPELLEESVDFVALGEQTAKLLSTVLVAAGVVMAWFIWQDMLPALSYLNQTTVFLEADPQKSLRWGQLLKFLLVLAVTYIATVNLPALMEFAILQRLPLDSGSRYAITSISRYIIVAIGLSTAYTSLGFDGTSIQWLVAAMGVGLGFGLQEIFANFVSGIILLFERPIRVGDVVTFGDRTGAVSRIRMRATTIVDADRKEYIVPNKDLITERLLNWTLTDGMNRVEVKVGVAYGTDTALVCRLLKEVAAEHPLILKEPEPTATLDAFGASTLDFALRCFLPTMEKRGLTIHDLNTAVNKKFAANNIEMAYPQADVYIKSWPERWTEPGVRAVVNGQDATKRKSHQGQEKN
jgi:potassium efflux system protein